MKKHNISRIMRIKHIEHMNWDVNFKASKNEAQISGFDSISEKMYALLGTELENYYVYEHLSDFKKFVVKRITTKLDDFQVHRVVRTKIGTDDDAPVQEDKITFTDPLIYFYRDKDGDGYPGAFLKNQFQEICSKKCIRSCKDGWYWTTNFHNKSDRKMADVGQLRGVMKNPGTTNTRMQLLSYLGVEPNEYGSGLTDLESQHSCKFAIGRDVPYPTTWYNDAASLIGPVSRDVTDHITFHMTTWITLRAYRGVE